MDTFPFMQLPPEIRSIVYHFALGGDRADVFLQARPPEPTATDEPSTSRDANEPSPPLPLTYTAIACRAALQGTTDLATATELDHTDYPLRRTCTRCRRCRPASGPRLSPSSLLLTCRTISREVLAQLYFGTTFVAASSRTLSSFLRQIGPANAARVAALRIPYTHSAHRHPADAVALRAGAWRDRDALAWDVEEPARGMPEVQSLTGLRSLHLLNVVGVAHPSLWLYLGAPGGPVLDGIEDVEDGGWTGGWVVGEDGRAQVNRDCLFAGIENFRRLRGKQVKVKVEVEVVVDHFDYECSEEFRAVVRERLGLTKEVTDSHVKAVREVLTREESD
ncbi:hypothetical protein B0J12DRAFT_745325 [Macrophomina phaseolina]|uniref:DUF7730 domain-containing protein n=1 Tax=Macrophomina phaseolina TaxID=35725 RepID=A0ABQ8FVM7_9PEZI|nr:hypothetical protein B0J12DRAFT_745325 [Macrophomina phaseolina]